MTSGQWMFYGGIAGAAFFLILLLIMIPLCRHRRKKMLKRILENG